MMNSTWPLSEVRHPHGMPTNVPGCMSLMAAWTRATSSSSASPEGAVVPISRVATPPAEENTSRKERATAGRSLAGNAESSDGCSSARDSTWVNTAKVGPNAPFSSSVTTVATSANSPQKADDRHSGASPAKYVDREGVPWVSAPEPDDAMFNLAGCCTKTGLDAEKTCEYRATTRGGDARYVSIQSDMRILTNAKARCIVCICWTKMKETP